MQPLLNRLFGAISLGAMSLGGLRVEYRTLWVLEGLATTVAVDHHASVVQLRWFARKLLVVVALWALLSLIRRVKRWLDCDTLAYRGLLTAVPQKYRPHAGLHIYREHAWWHPRRWYGELYFLLERAGGHPTVVQFDHARLWQTIYKQADSAAMTTSADDGNDDDKGVYVRLSTLVESQHYEEYIVSRLDGLLIEKEGFKGYSVVSVLQDLKERTLRTVLCPCSSLIKRSWWDALRRRPPQPDTFVTIDCLDWATGDEIAGVLSFGIPVALLQMVVGQNEEGKVVSTKGIMEWFGEAAAWSENEQLMVARGPDGSLTACHVSIPSWPLGVKDARPMFLVPFTRAAPLHEKWVFMRRWAAANRARAPRLIHGRKLSYHVYRKAASDTLALQAVGSDKVLTISREVITRLICRGHASAGLDDSLCPTGQCWLTDLRDQLPELLEAPAISPPE